jgi:stage II sporulation protein D
LVRKGFPEIGNLERIEVLSTSSSGRVRQARVVGSAGAVVVTGAELRSRLGLKSTLVQFSREPINAPLFTDQAGTASDQLTAPRLVPPPLPALNALAAPSPLQWVAIGRGFGHGIGMSQWGACAMARRGEGFEQILQHYYRGTQLRPYSSLAALAPLLQPRLSLAPIKPRALALTLGTTP